MRPGVSIRGSRASAVSCQRQRASRCCSGSELAGGGPSVCCSSQERRQLAADQRHWQRRLEAIESELSSEPARIKASYEVVTHRLEPAGLVYLWPISG